MNKKLILVSVVMILLVSVVVGQANTAQTCDECRFVDSAWQFIGPLFGISLFYDPDIPDWVPGSKYLTAVPVQATLADLDPTTIKHLLDNVETGVKLGGIEGRVWTKEFVLVGTPLQEVKWVPDLFLTRLGWTSEEFSQLIFDKITAGQKLTIPRQDAYVKYDSILQALVPGVKIKIDNKQYDVLLIKNSQSFISGIESYTRDQFIGVVETAVNANKEVIIVPEYFKPGNLTVSILSPRMDDTTRLTVNFIAQARGGEGKYTYSWIGLGTDVNKDSFTFDFRDYDKFKEGEKSEVIVQVKDEKGAKASATVGFYPETRNSNAIFLYDGSSVPTLLQDKQFKFINGRWKWSYNYETIWKELSQKTVTGSINDLDTKELSDGVFLPGGIGWWDAVFNELKKPENINSFISGVEILTISANDDKTEIGWFSNPSLKVKSLGGDITHECCAIKPEDVAKEARID